MIVTSMVHFPLFEEIMDNQTDDDGTPHKSQDWDAAGQHGGNNDQAV